jgi:hypothetical protein
MTRLGCRRFRSNEVRLWLSVIAYNLGNLWRRLYHRKSGEGWSLTSLQQRLVKMCGQGGGARPVLLATVGRDRGRGDTRQLSGGAVCEAFELSYP